MFAERTEQQWINRYANYAINEAVHEALEWFRVDGRPWLDPHGDLEDAIYEAVNELADKLPPSAHDGETARHRYERQQSTGHTYSHLPDTPQPAADKPPIIDQSAPNDGDSLTYQQPIPDHDPAQQQSWGNPPQPTGFITTDAPPPQKPSRKPLIVAALTAVGVLLTGTIGYAVWDGLIREDSGVAACKAIAAGKKMDGSPKTTGGDGTDNDKMTEAEYRAAREIFAKSRHEKLREHGTGLVDVAWQIQGLGDGNEMAGLAFIGPMGTHISGLQSACADQGVIVDLSSD